jgi:hypothetical protein
VAESYAKRLTAFEIATDGGLSNRRVWADLGDGVPDGICYDAARAVWYSDVPNKRCVRVRQGGEVLQTIKLDYGCFACALGGLDGRTLFMMATVWRGPENMFAEPRTRSWPRKPQHRGPAGHRRHGRGYPPQSCAMRRSSHPALPVHGRAASWRRAGQRVGR